MAVDTLHDPEKGIAVMFDNTTDVAFGPLFESPEDVESFLAYVRDQGFDDVRFLTDDRIKEVHSAWHRAKEEAWTCSECGKEMNPVDVLLSRRPGPVTGPSVCGDCVRKIHLSVVKEVTG